MEDLTVLAYKAVFVARWRPPPIKNPNLKSLGPDFACLNKKNRPPFCPFRR